MLYIYNLEISSPSNCPLTQLMNFISKERQDKISSYRFEIDKLLSLYGALLVRMGVGKLTGLPNERLDFSIEGNGKPFLLYPPGVFFNLTHTRSKILVCFSDESAVGADIEKIKSDPPYEIMPECFHPYEIEHVNSVTGLKKAISFYKIWTKKEAYTKQSGIGLLQDIKTINVFDLPLKCQTYVENNYISSVCYKKASALIQREITEQELREYFL